MRGEYKQSLEYEQIKGTGWDEKHISLTVLLRHTSGQDSLIPRHCREGALNTNKPDEKPELL